MRLSLLTALALAACATPPPVIPPSTPYVPDDASLELHAHLFMKEGMGFAFDGDFFGPLVGRRWDQTNVSQANPETVERSGIGLMVVSLAGYPVLSLAPRDAVRRQVALAERFVLEHPSWSIARRPAEARSALDAGKRVLVLALEPNILETDADLDEFVDRLGIRIVTFLHILDDDNGGAALLPGSKAAVAAGTVAFHSRREEGDQVLVNTHGLTERGRALAQKLIARGVWIDLAHASDASAHELLALTDAAGLPALITHTGLRRHQHAERAAPDWELEAVGRSGGVVGLVPSEEMVGATPVPPEACAAGCPLPCAGGIQALAYQWREVASIVSPEQIGLGSDYSDGIGHLRPSCPTGTELDDVGLWHIGQAGAVWEAVEKLGAPVPKPRRRVVDHFVEAWSRVASRAAPPPPPAQ